jgi:hypothetical protein
MNESIVVRLVVVIGVINIVTPNRESIDQLTRRSGQNSCFTWYFTTSINERTASRIFGHKTSPTLVDACLARGSVFAP